MHIKKTYVCLEPGEIHPALCVLVKHTQQIGILKPTFKTVYDVRTLDALPAKSPYFDIIEKTKVYIKLYVTGDIRFILGHTNISESFVNFFERAKIKSLNITVTGDQEPYKDNFMLYAPYREIVETMDALKEQDVLTFAEDTSESDLIKDDDLDLSLGMAVWYATNDEKQFKEKKPL